MQTIPMPASDGLVCNCASALDEPVNGLGSELTRLHKCDRGAIMVFGIFFAVVVLAMLYYMVGLGATMFYRERLQDAADGSAFASAIVHARGMNTLALINVVMAALLAVLVALRLVEALIIIAEVILYALAWLGGATAAIASALEVVRQAVHEVAEAAEPVIFNANKVLKLGGEVVRVATPIAANFSVLGKVALRYEPEVRVAFAIPPRITLPVEDDTFPYLCGKAGKIAGILALLPIRPILPGGLRKKLESALGKLTKRGASWFCDGSDPPTFTTDPEVNNFPATEEMEKCTNRDKQDADSVTLCHAAEKAEGAGEPDEKTGLCRVGQPLCQPVVDPESDPPGLAYQYSSKSYCGSEDGKLAKVTDRDCHEVDAPDGRKVADVATPYGKRLAKARADCDPKHRDREDYWWIERELDVTWQWDATTGAWTERQAIETVAPVALGRPAVKRVPCEGHAYQQVSAAGVLLYGRVPDGKWNDNSKLEEPVCQVDEPRPPAPAEGELPAPVVRKRTEVLQVLGCSSEQAAGKEVVVGAVNLAADQYTQGVDDFAAKPGGTGGDYGDLSTDDLGIDDGSSDASGGSSNTLPYRFIKGHRLGTSDMQIRSLVVGNRLADVHTGAQAVSVHEDSARIVSMSKWRTSGDELSGLASASETWGLFSVAQAEYYFAVETNADDLASWGEKWDEQNDEDSGRDFLWKMAWTARMRRFRLNWKVDGQSADEGSQTGSSDGDTMLDKLDLNVAKEAFGEQSSDEIATHGPKALCSLGDMADVCEQFSQMMRSYDSIFIH